jgi:hypothetical protein
MANESFGAQGLVIQGAAPEHGLDRQSFARGAVQYDNPFMDMTSTFIPRTIKSMLRFTAAFALSDGLVSQCISKLAEYPITKLIYNDEKKSNIDKDKTITYWQDLFEKKIDILRVLKQCGMDYYAYGNSMISINWPFRRLLICPRCKKKHSAEAMNYKFRAFKFEASCITPKCGYRGVMDAMDEPTKELNKLKIVHWDLLHIDIKYNPISGDHFYYYTIPADLAGAIHAGDRDIVRTTRLEVIEAVKRKKQLKLMSDNLYHLKRAAPQYIIPSQRGWGIPIIMPIMKDMFHNKILKKGNEMIAFDHIVPLRILFPAGTGDVSPHLTTNLSRWKTNIEQEIQAWKRDPNRISVVPLPLGTVNFSGDARLLMLTPEIKAVEDSIITGLGIIPEIVRGGASWSGSNVSLRIVENTFINHRNDISNILDFIVENVSRYLDKPKISIKMSDFKMADDLQKKQLMIQATQGGTAQALFSKSTVTKEFGYDPDKEYELKQQELKKTIETAVQEAEGQAEAQGAASVISALYQADAQMENQKRMEQHDRKNVADRDDAMQKEKMQNVANVEQEAISLANGSQISVPNLILILTQRFARLASINMDEFKIRMIAMKNSTPNLYHEVYNNLKEMNLIQADTMPNMEEVQKLTPGQIPQYSQGDENADAQPSPAEAGPAPAAQVLQPLPEVKPPMSATNASV